MAVIVDLSVDATDFVFGDLSDEIGCKLDLDRIVPLEEGIFPYVWVTGCDSSTFAQRATHHSAIDDVTQIEAVGDHALFRIRWNQDIDSIVDCFVDTNATILEASGGPVWSFRLRFSDHQQMKQFHEQCDDYDIDITPHRIRDFDRYVDTASKFDLSEEQYAALVLAAEKGYFEIPRQATLSDIASELDISEQATSERLRRAMDTIAADLVSSRTSD